ncbi:MAG: FHA domain-containing protein [Clostridia bacterium]|nr:FHA domain-containing protein [Clostridia bacterium]
MIVITAVSRYILPSLALIILFKCILTLLLGHPKEKIYAYITDMNTGERHPLNMWETSLGRSNSSDIVLPYSAVSRTHAVISRRIDGWYIYDLDSKSGIRVNENKIDEKMTIKNGDMLSFADANFRFEVADDPVQHVGKHKKRGAPPQPVAYQGGVSPYGGTENQRGYSQPRMINTRTGEVFVLVGNRVTVGASAKSDIRISYGQGVSRQHSLLVLYEDGWAITDNNSTNGTLLNGRKISQPQLLFDGDIITLGTESLLFKIKMR